jgi:hypothetical protein
MRWSAGWSIRRSRPIRVADVRAEIDSLIAPVPAD